MVSPVYLCESDDLAEGCAKGLEIGEQKLFLVRKYGQVFGYLNACPHLGIPLEWQADQFLDEEAELIHCSTHGALFTIEDGLCVAGPCVNRSLETIAINEAQGQITWQP